MSRIQKLALVSAVLLGWSGSTLAADPPQAGNQASGFYGGIALRESGRTGDGLTIGHLNSVWSRFAMPVTDDSGTRTLAYGGYRWTNDLAVEAAFATRDRYALQPNPAGARRGVGLALAPDADPGKAWNVDVYTSWEFRKRLALYGRLGYVQSEAPSASYLPGLASDAVRRSREGVNYGVGLRYDMTSALGLRLEYARFARMPGELSSGLMPENDQVQLGVQFRF
ncbi:MAG: outer membrane beta-barrel protein [Burkholderiales bacterium]|nr:outer membrane beta-barrel protein [Burkholderiales bacterium]